MVLAVDHTRTLHLLPPSICCPSRRKTNAALALFFVQNEFGMDCIPFPPQHKHSSIEHRWGRLAGVAARATVNRPHAIDAMFLMEMVWLSSYNHSPPKLAG
jgi:hypothetical protein